MSTKQPISKSLDVRIRERIIKRLGKRVRNLNVRIDSGTIQLAGECSTYYTKQLVQNAVLGVVENEAVRNEIVVTVPRNNHQP